MNKALKTIRVLLHPIEKTESVRIDFETELNETDVYESLKLVDYKIYQFIQNDYLYKMKMNELDSENIKYHKFKREKTTWFGLFKKSVTDILIHPKSGFYYPYDFGHYFYLFTKHKININDFENWLNLHFSNPFADFDKCWGIGVSKGFKLLNKDDYFLITNHDLQSDIGITASEIVADKLLEKLDAIENHKKLVFERK